LNASAYLALALFLQLRKRNSHAQAIRMLRNRKGTTAHQGRQHSDKDLQAVGDIYLAAYKARIPVQKAVADALGISVSTAAKRIMAARQQGFITST
jgi:hypothetical protein